MRRTAAVFALQGLGNSALALPLVCSLLERYDVTVHVKRNGSERLYAELPIDVRVRSYASRAELFRAPLDAADCAIAATPTGRSESLGVARTPTHRRLSFRGHWSLLNLALARPPAAHDVENNAALGERAGVAPTAVDVGPLIRGASHAPDADVVALHPTASTRAKYYPEEFWMEIVRALADRGMRISIYAGPAAAERDFAVGVARAGGSGVRTVLGAPLGEVAREIASASAFIGSDSALMHLAALSGVRTVGLWSFADVRRVHPYGRDAAVYLPREVLRSRHFDYPDRAPGWLARARADDVLEILDGRRRVDFTLPARLAASTRVHLY